MKALIGFVCGCGAAAAVSASGVNAPPTITLDQIVQTRTLGQFAMSPDGSRVAYTIAGYYLGFPLIPRFGEENNIRIVSLETGEIVQVTSGPTAKTSPVFSPSGERIAFESDNDIWIADVKTGATKRLTMGLAGVRSRAPAWSPDGTHLVFVSNRRGKTDLWIVSTEGERQGLVQLTSDDASEDDPDWSPDGRTIAFSAKRSSEYYMATGVYTVPAAGGPATRITPTDTTDNFAPRWSPDGKRLAVLSGDQRGAKLSVVSVGVMRVAGPPAAGTV